MKTARFSQVVDHAGKPEVYLLFSPDDPVFTKALKADRIMTVVEHGSSPAYGTVGYDTHHRGQLLLFPRPLEKFAGMRIVGVKFDLFAEDSVAPKKAPTPPKAAKPQPEKKPEATPERKPEPKPERARKQLELKPSKPKAASTNVIAFPKPKSSPEDKRVEKLKDDARQALASLEAFDTKEAICHLQRLLKRP